MSLLQIRLEKIPPTQFGRKLCPNYNFQKYGFELLKFIMYTAYING
jgi:hypothetical protein